MPAQPDIRARLLAVLAVVVVAAALKATQPVTMPLVTAVFLLVLVWPLHAWMNRVLPRAVAFVLTILTVLVAMAAFILMIAWSLSTLVDRAPDFVARLQQLRDEISGWARERDLLSQTGDEADGLGTEALIPVLGPMWQAGAILFLTIAFFVLALGEIDRFHDKLFTHFGARGQTALDGIRDVGGRVRKFMLALTLAGLLAGVASALYGLAMGLEHVLVWAFLAYLLSYIPVIGSTLAVFPPTLWALVQFDGIGRPLAVLIGFGAIQFVVGNYIAPKFEGRYTNISSLIVLVSIVLWGWIWGPVGAVLGVPLTVAIVMACSHFESTRWVAALLSER